MYLQAIHKTGGVEASHNATLAWNFHGDPLKL